MAGAISAACHCKCQGAAGASQAASGVSGPSGMIPRWPRLPLSLRARTGVALGSGKGGHGLRSQSRRWTHQRLVVEGRDARLALASFIRSKGAFSACQTAPATEGVGRISGRASASSEAHAEHGGTQGEALTGCERTIHTASLVAPHMRVFYAGGDREGAAFS